MVSDLFELDGWDTYFVGADAPIDSVIRTVRERRADALADVDDADDSHSLREILDRRNAGDADCANVAILVGGRPLGWNLNCGAISVLMDAQATPSRRLHLQTGSSSTGAAW